jgi:NDP-4-keto-2,6-dideoxyhexose 3-C-methyltransferase
MALDKVCAERTSCRICGSKRFESVIDLGRQFIASAFVGDVVPENLNRPYPTEVMRCVEGCGLVQLRHSIHRNLLYVDGYGYRSGTNELMRTNLRSITAGVESVIHLQAGDTVLDIGCNDGTLLDSYQVKGLEKVGFEPISSIARIARDKGIAVINDFFSGWRYLEERPGRKPRAVTSIAMFYDLEEPQEFAKDVAGLLADDGVWVIELSYLPTMLEKVSFDTVCHEHLEYYTLRQIEWMAERAGLTVNRVEFNDVNGGSIRVFLCLRGHEWHETHGETVEAVRRKEKALKLDSDEPYRKFRDASKRIGQELQDLLRKLKAEGKKVYVYGASTKGNTLLQFCGIDHSLIGKAADRNPEKWGRHTLGTNIPIISEEQARADKPDYFLVLPWHFFSGFVTREAEFLARGGKFILPVPRVTVVGAEDLRNRH